MKPTPTILLIGTVDTKSDEIGYLRGCIERSGGRALVMDVGVLGCGAVTPDLPNTEVAAAAGVTLPHITTSGGENTAMTLMAQGASLLAARLHAEGRIDGLLALGGSMGTDLALDVANALPLGVPKVVLSTIAYSHLIPPERIPPDLIMRLWAGGLYGLNRLCRTALAQAAGATVGACLADVEPHGKRPVIGMTSLGSSALTYMKLLKGPIEERGYELAVFHTTGMGGRAFEDLAARGFFAAVMDFSLQELVNAMNGSCVSSGPDRLRGAGRAGTPQIVAPGATDMVDYPTWSTPPAAYAGRPVAHTHNRLIASLCIDVPMRRAVAHEIGQRLAEAKGPTALLLPRQGIEGWDREGGPLHDPEGLAALVEELPRALAPSTRLVALDAHINDAAFAQAALDVLDDWVRDGLVRAGVRESA
ncbi:Tm-1-like ATP-binding domain-containing protein [Piscinibacter sp.]|uniref:Tm-1-like ATP-binding domain-containing protein n=1 Tax=Piscinibacter sp. TaxID=1903157 RepID=UPI002CA6A2D9|nr:Tm-1-like ATP-binding domain-containing protein [Albitalea sp.]HUG21043.1 Tm-1-like ATP-binding domain-containing protein [Albitalea sp.]